MLRWRMLTVLGLVTIGAGGVGCTRATARDADFSPRPSVGLANAPALYGSPQSNDQKPHDVVANGLESCGQYLENGVLRYQWPPCPAPQAGSQPSAVTVGSFGPVVPPISASPPSAFVSRASSVTLWHEKFVVEWPCANKAVADDEKLAVVACTAPEP